MHRAITDKVHLEQTSNPADNTGKVQSIDYANDFEDIDKETNKLQKFFENSVNTDLLRYLPAILPLVYQGMIYSLKTKKVTRLILHTKIFKLYNLVLNCLQINTLIRIVFINY